MAAGRKLLNDRTMELVAERFRLLGDPLRLRLLQLLGDREHSVAELVEATSASQANISKHLQLLLRAGLVVRRKAGLFVYYSVRDPRVFQLCDLVCGSLAETLQTDLTSLEGAGREPAAGVSPRAPSASSSLSRRRRKA